MLAQAMTMKDTQAENAIQDNKMALQRGRKHIGWVFFIILVLLVGAAVVLLLWWMRQPGEGVVSIREGKPRGGEAADQVPYTHWSGKYGRFSHPASFVVKTHTKDVSEIDRESVFLTEQGVGGRKIAYSLRKYDDSRLSDIPSVRLRDLDGDQYQKEVREIAGYSGLLYSKERQVFEETFFFKLQGGLFVSISLSSPITPDGLREDLEALIRSFMTVDSQS